MSQRTVFMTDSEWVEKYKPTTEEALPDLPDVDNKTVWTQIDSDGEVIIVSGIHFVNRLGYWITEVPHNNDIIEVK